MVEHLPAGNPLERARAGGWDSAEALLWQVESRLRDLIILTGNIHRARDAAPLEVSYLPHPETPEEQERAKVQAAYDAAMQAQLDDLW